MRSQETNGRGLAEIASIMRARAGWIIAATAVGVVLAAVVSAVMRPVYRAELAVVVAPKSLQSSRPDLGRILGTWIYLLSDGSTREAARAQLADRYESEELKTVRVGVQPVDHSMVVVMTVRAGKPQLVLDFAQAVFEVAGAREMAALYPVNRVGAAQLTGNPESPKLRRNILLGGCAGLLIGIALAFLFVDLGRRGWNPRSRSDIA